MLSESRRRWDCGSSDCTEWACEGNPNANASRCDGDFTRYQGSTYKIVFGYKRICEQNDGDGAAFDRKLTQQKA